MSRDHWSRILSASSVSSSSVMDDAGFEKANVLNGVRGSISWLNIQYRASEGIAWRRSSQIFDQPIQNRCQGSRRRGHRPDARTTSRTCPPDSHDCPTRSPRSLGRRNSTPSTRQGTSRDLRDPSQTEAGLSWSWSSGLSPGLSFRLRSPGQDRTAI